MFAEVEFSIWAIHHGGIRPIGFPRMEHFPNLPDFVVPGVQMVFLNQRSHSLSVEDKDQCWHFFADDCREVVAFPRRMPRRLQRYSRR